MEKSTLKANSHVIGRMRSINGESSLVEYKGMKIDTPYPKEVKKSDVDFIGNELAKLSERLNEIELSVSDLTVKLKVVTGRMGL